MLGDLVNKVADSELLDWKGRTKLIDGICGFVVLAPHIGQVIICVYKDVFSFWYSGGALLVDRWFPLISFTVVSLFILFSHCLWS